MKVNVTENRLSGGYASGNTKLNVHQYLLACMNSMATTLALQSVSREQSTNNSHTFNIIQHHRFAVGNDDLTALASICMIRESFRCFSSANFSYRTKVVRRN